MGRFKQILNKLKYRFKPALAVEIARDLGVRFADKPGKDGCFILTEPIAAFGSEPYLVKLGHRVLITAGVKFITHDGGLSRLDTPECNNMDYFAPIKVGNNVFIGNNSIILPGVTIGDNVVVGAGSIVARDIPSNCVCAGVPAKVIKSIDEYRDKLIKNGAMPTRRMNKEQKKAAIMEAHPEWFE